LAVLRVKLAVSLPKVAVSLPKLAVSLIKLGVSLSKLALPRPKLADSLLKLGDLLLKLGDLLIKLGDSLLKLRVSLINLGVLIPEIGVILFELAVAFLKAGRLVCGSFVVVYSGNQLFLATHQPQGVEAFAEEIGELRQGPLHVAAMRLLVDDAQIAGRSSRTEIAEQPEVVLVSGAFHKTCYTCLDESSPGVPAVMNKGDGPRVMVEDDL
jgi:hypothetical protein